MVAVSRKKKLRRMTMSRLACVLLSFFVLGMLSCRACDCTVPEPEFGKKNIVLPEPRPQPPRPAPPETETTDDGDTAAKAPVKIVRYQNGITGFTKEQMEDPTFNKKLNSRQRKAILHLEKLQKTDPRFKQVSKGVPAPPLEEEEPFKGSGKKRKKRKKRNK
jgi:hypothetical protein